MNACWKSRIGWAFVAAYLILASLLFHQALTCTGWVCDLVALPVVFPLGFPISWLTDWVHAYLPIPGHTPSFHLRNWYFILPTASANALFYYWVGRQLQKLRNRLHQHSANRC